MQLSQFEVGISGRNAMGPVNANVKFMAPLFVDNKTKTSLGLDVRAATYADITQHLGKYSIGLVGRMLGGMTWSLVYMLTAIL